MLTDSPDKNIKRPALDICSAPKVDELDVALTVQDDILVFDIAMHDLCREV